jgi:hypothetical protein
MAIPHKDKNIRKYLEELVCEGWELLGGRKHYKIRSPKGHIVSMSKSPSCPYMIKHLKGDVQRIKQNELS